MTITNKHIVLAKRPNGYPQPDDFALTTSELRQPKDGEFLTENLYASLDAGFRNWMNEGAGDEVLPAMPLNEPVMGLTLSKVIESKHPDYKEGDMLMARFAWEEYSISDGTDFIAPLGDELEFPLSFYMGLLGDTGMSAYFGLTEVAVPKPGETVLISAAGGAVGSIAGQIAKILGAKAIGITSSQEKCQRLIDELGYDGAVNRNAPEGISAAIKAACPDGIDVFLDSVGGETLEAAITNLNPGARIAMCGSITAYNAAEPLPGPTNLFELVTKEVNVQGYLTHLREARYPEARAQLAKWLDEGKLKNVEYQLQGVENIGVAFCDLFSGKNFGKTVVKISEG